MYVTKEMEYGRHFGHKYTNTYYYYYSISYNFMPIYNTIAEPIPWA